MTGNRTNEARIDDDCHHIYWLDPVEGCWVAFKRTDCVGEEELPVGRLAEHSISQDNEGETAVGLHFSEAHVEAAWQSLLETATDVTTRGDVRAALVAAANTAQKAPYSDPVMTAPQAVEVQKSAEIDHLPPESSISVLPSSTVDEVLPRAEREARCPYSHQMDRCATCGWLRSPALPPVPVDEEALAEVIAHAESDWQFKFDQFRSETGVDPGPKAEYVARAVAEWLKEQGR